MMGTETTPEVTYIAKPLARDALRLYLGESANILPIPEDENGVEFLREQMVGSLILVPMSDKDRTVRSTAIMLKNAGIDCMVSPVSAEWFLSTTLPPGKLESLLKGAPRDNCGHVVLTLQEFFEQTIPDAVQLLGPIHEADVGFIAAWRGTGKTLFNLSMAVAIGGGLPFLGWECPAPRKVLYVDGEMPFALLRSHLTTVMESFKPFGKGEFNPENLRILTPDVQPDGLEPDLSTKTGRQRMDDIIGDAEFVVLDNLSALVGGDAENDSEAFEPIRKYQKSLRRRNIASTLIHHAGKGGDQRGHSGKEDLTDFSALLEPPSERSEATGAKFKLRWKKVRRDLPFLRELDIELQRGNPPVWHYQTIGEAVQEIVQRLSDEGHAIREIVSILREDHGIRKSKNTIANMVKK